MSDSFPAAVSIGEATIFQYLQKEAVLLNMATQQYFALDDVGAEMWRLLLEDGNIEATVGRLIGIYKVDEARLRGDLESLVRDLLGAGLLKKVEPDCYNS